MRRAIAAQSAGPRGIITNSSLAMGELHLPLVACGSTVWQAPSLSVSIRPEFAIRDARGKVLRCAPRSTVRQVGKLIPGDAVDLPAVQVRRRTGRELPPG